jgi:hypothetical protein
VEISAKRRIGQTAASASASDPPMVERTNARRPTPMGSEPYSSKGAGSRGRAEFIRATGYLSQMKSEPVCDEVLKIDGIRQCPVGRRIDTKPEAWSYSAERPNNCSFHKRDWSRWAFAE